MDSHAAVIVAITQAQIARKDCLGVALSTWASWLACQLQDFVSLALALVYSRISMVVKTMAAEGDSRNWSSWEEFLQSRTQDL